MYFFIQKAQPLTHIRKLVRHSKSVTDVTPAAACRQYHVILPKHLLPNYLFRITSELCNFGLDSLCSRFTRLRITCYGVCQTCADLGQLATEGLALPWHHTHIGVTAILQN